MQICLVTDDLERSLDWFADLTGKTLSHVGKAADPDKARAIYKGEPASANCRLATFRFGTPQFGVQLELLERDDDKEGQA